MANPWFRMYHEFADDPKVQMMPEAMQRRLVMLFCSKCKGETLHETEIAFHWRITETELAETKSLFLQKEFIDEDWNLLNWNRRQFLSDSSTDRVRRFRQGKKQDETLHETDGTKSKQSSPVTVTPPDTDTDTDTDTDHKKTLASTAIAVPAARGKLIGTLPLAGGQHYEVREDDIARDGPLYPGVDLNAEYRKMKGWLLADPKRQKTPKGIRKFINNWLSSAQDNLRGRNNARPDAVLERQKQNLANIEAAARRLEDADGPGGGFLSEPDAPTGDAGRLHVGVEADRGQAWPESFPERTMERSAQIGFLSIAEGYR